MLRSILFFLSLFLILIIGILWFFRVQLAEQFLTKQFNQKTTIKNMIVIPQSILLEEVKVSQFTISRIEVEMNPLSFFRNNLNIKRIRILHPTLGETKQLLMEITDAKKYTIGRIQLYDIAFENSEIWPIPYLELHPKANSLKEILSEVFANIDAKKIENNSTT